MFALLFIELCNELLILENKFYNNLNFNVNNPFLSNVFIYLGIIGLKCMIIQTSTTKWRIIKLHLNFLTFTFLKEYNNLWRFYFKDPLIIMFINDKLY